LQSLKLWHLSIFYMLVRQTLPKDWKEAEDRNNAGTEAETFA